MSFLHPSFTAVKAGAYRMGDETGGDDEKPVHEVFVDAFLIGTYPVTNREFREFVRATGYAFAVDSPFPHPYQPVTHVSWFDAMEYCAWLSRETGGHYRLPTEGEWEYAARSGSSDNTYPWGTQKLEVSGHFQKGPEPVGAFEANAFGIHDMGMNVHEWCSDWYGADYYAHSPAHNPKGPEQGTRKSSRGGSWRHQIKVTRCAARSSIPPDYRYADYGFRVVQTLI